MSIDTQRRTAMRHLLYIYMILGGCRESTTVIHLFHFSYHEHVLSSPKSAHSSISSNPMPSTSSPPTISDATRPLRSSLCLLVGVGISHSIIRSLCVPLVRVWISNRIIRSLCVPLIGVGISNRIIRGVSFVGVGIGYGIIRSLCVSFIGVGICHSVVGRGTFVGIWVGYGVIVWKSQVQDRCMEVVKYLLLTGAAATTRANVATKRVFNCMIAIGLDLLERWKCC